MGIIATFDLGTSAVKGVFVDGFEIIFSSEHEIKTYIADGFIEQDPNEWYQAFCCIAKDFFTQNPVILVEGIVMSGQMQNVIAVNKNCDSIYPSIEYNDQRGIIPDIDNKLIDNIKLKTANDFNPSSPLAKILWLKQHKPEIYHQAQSLLNSSKDYIIAKLTNCFASDFVSLSTGAYFDIKEKKYLLTELAQCGLDSTKLPAMYSPEQIVGKVTLEAGQQTGFKIGTPVFAGSGDAGATTLASGIIHDGEININLGTSGWVAGISNNIRKNVFNLSAINRNLYINIVPILNAGNVHKWVASAMYGGLDKYQKVHEALYSEPTCKKGLFFLPYITGERFPVADSKVRGAYIGINPDTERADLVKAALEGVAFSIKQCLDRLAIDTTKISLIGGGAREAKWCQIFSDLIEKELVVYKNSEFLPSMALSALAKKGLGTLKSYSDFILELKKHEYDIFKPIEKNRAAYQEGYKKFIQIYPNVGKIWS